MINNCDARIQSALNIIDTISLIAANEISRIQELTKQNTFYCLSSLLKCQLIFKRFFLDLRAFLLTMHNKLVHKTPFVNELATDNMKLFPVNQKTTFKQHDIS